MKDKIMRIEVWFKDGLFRAFPEVDSKTIEKKDGILTFNFGANRGNDHCHVANINLENVNFFESWLEYEEDVKEEKEEFDEDLK